MDTNNRSIWADDDSDDLDLSQYDQAFTNAGDPRDRVPDGVYTCKVRSARIGRAQKSGAPMVIWTMDVCEPEDFRGATIVKRSSFASQGSIGMMKRELCLCGFEPDTASAVREVLPSLVGLTLEVAQRTVNTDSSYYIRRKLA